MKSKLLVVIVALLFVIASGTTYLVYNNYREENIKTSSTEQDEDEKEKTSIPKETEQVKKEEGQRAVGFGMNGDEIQKAENVPSDRGKGNIRSI